MAGRRPATGRCASRVVRGRLDDCRAARPAGRARRPRPTRRRAICRSARPARRAKGSRALKPEPWQPDRAAICKAIDAFLAGRAEAEIVWFSDGLAGDGDEAFLATLARPRRQGAASTVIARMAHGPLALAGAEQRPGRHDGPGARAAAGAPATGTVRALDLKSLPLGEAPFAFQPGAARDHCHASTCRSIFATTSPGSRSSARHRPAPCNCSTTAGAGASVGIVSGQDSGCQRSRCSRPTIICSRALQPFADVRAGRGRLARRGDRPLHRRQAAGDHARRCRQSRRCRGQARRLDR